MPRDDWQVLGLERLTELQLHDAHGLLASDQALRRLAPHLSRLSRLEVLGLHKSGCVRACRCESATVQNCTSFGANYLYGVFELQFCKHVGCAPYLPRQSKTGIATTHIPNEIMSAFMLYAACRCSLVGDAGLAAVSASCRALRSLALVQLPGVTDWGLEALAGAQPGLREVRLSGLPRVSSTVSICMA